MKLVEELRGISDESIIAVLTGNGRTELTVLKYLAEKHNGSKKVLFLPRPPIHLRPVSGLSALRAVKTYLNYRITRTLFLVDREHFDEEEVIEKIDGTLKSFGIDIQNIELFQEEWECALFIKASVGHREVTIYVVILGENKCIEEDIAKLVELELGINIEPKKEVIHNALRKHGIDKYILVKKAQNRNLTKAFPGLTLMLKKIEKNDIE